MHVYIYFLHVQSNDKKSYSVPLAIKCNCFTVTVTVTDEKGIRLSPSRYWEKVSDDNDVNALLPKLTRCWFRATFAQTMIYVRSIGSPSSLRQAPRASSEMMSRYLEYPGVFRRGRMHRIRGRHFFWPRWGDFRLDSSFSYLPQSRLPPWSRVFVSLRTVRPFGVGESGILAF